jgi:hypothetical protein
MQKSNEVLDDIIDDLAIRDELKDTFILFFSSTGRGNPSADNKRPAYSFTTMDEVQQEYLEGEGYCPCDDDALETLKEGYSKFRASRYSNIYRSHAIGAARDLRRMADSPRMADAATRSRAGPCRGARENLGPGRVQARTDRG